VPASSSPAARTGSSVRSRPPPAGWATSTGPARSRPANSRAPSAARPPRPRVRTVPRQRPGSACRARLASTLPSPQATCGSSARSQAARTRCAFTASGCSPSGSCSRTRLRPCSRLSSTRASASSPCQASCQSPPPPRQRSGPRQRHWRAAAGAGAGLAGPAGSAAAASPSAASGSGWHWNRTSCSRCPNCGSCRLSAVRLSSAGAAPSAPGASRRSMPLADSCGCSIRSRRRCTALPAPGSAARGPAASTRASAASAA
jgi:hypothetical protein